MSEESSHKWRGFIYTVVITMLFIGGLYFFMESFFPSKTQQSNAGGLDSRSARFFNSQTRDTPNPLETYDPESKTITLLQKQSATVNGIKIIYLGLAKDRKFKIDAYILSFDSQMPFHLELKIAEAQKGFRIGSKRFKLLSAKRNRLQMRHLP